MKQFCKAFLLMFLGLTAVAQESSAPRVVIPLTAKGSHHRPISVTVESLAIKDQKTLITGATLLRGADLPVELGVLIDVSNSQRSVHFDDILKAMSQFVDEVIRGPEDRVFFLEFDATPMTTGWMKKEQLQGMTVKLRMGGGTALYDALALACKERMGTHDWRKPTRRVLVLISDGDDNLSHITRDAAVSEVLNAGAVVFTINTSYGYTKGGNVMEGWAKITGGESFYGTIGSDSPKAFASIKAFMDGMYYLSYVPPDTTQNVIHEVEVKPAQKEKLDLSYAKKYLWN